MRKLLLLITIFVYGTCALAENSIHKAPYGAKLITYDAYRMHMMLLYICCAIGLAVFCAIIYCMIKFRRSKTPSSGNNNQHISLEIIWTIIPFIILVAMTTPAVYTLIHMHHDSKPKITTNPPNTQRLKKA